MAIGIQPLKCRNHDEIWGVWKIEEREKPTIHRLSTCPEFPRFNDSTLSDTDTDLHVSFQRTACGQETFSYRGAKLWNDQNTEAKKAKSFAQFKTSLKNDRS